MYKVEIGGLVVHVDSVEELREVIANFSGTHALKGVSTAPNPATPAPNPDTAVTYDGPVPKNVPRGAKYAPTEVKIRSANTEDAMVKLYKGLDNATHRDALRFLASKGEQGAGIDELKEALKLPPNHKMGGLTAAIRRRAPHYGLQPDDVLIVEYRGIVANVRILDYRLAPEMLAMMRKNGFAEWEGE